MNEAEYRAELQSIVTMAALIPRLKIWEVLQAMERAETVGPIADPTLFREASPKLQRQKEIVAAALEFQRAIEVILEGQHADQGPGGQVPICNQ